jgi:hypothetical protein
MAKVVRLKMSTQSVVEQLIEHQRNRRFAIKSQQRCDRAVESFLARDLGHQRHLRYQFPRADPRRVATSVSASVANTRPPAA